MKDIIADVTFIIGILALGFLAFAAGFYRGEASTMDKRMDAYEQAARRLANHNRTHGNAKGYAMISVTYRHEEECRLYHDGERWFYGAVWMPIDAEYTINVTRNGMEMMQNEKDEGEPQPDGKNYYVNARRFYRDVVEAELRDEQQKEAA